MLLVLFLSAYVAAEWVEIAQQHYRKPLKPHSSFATIHKPLQDDTEKPWEYRNQSIISEELSVPTRRIDAFTKNPFLEVDKGTFHFEEKFSEEHSAIVNLKGSVEKVPNVGSVKRVELSNSPVKSPSIKFKSKDVTDRYVQNKDIERVDSPLIKPVHRKVQTNLVIHKTTPRNTFLATQGTADYQDDGYTEAIPVLKKTIPQHEVEKYNSKKPLKSESITETILTSKENNRFKVTNQGSYISRKQKDDVFDNDITKIGNGITELKQDVNSSKKDRNNSVAPANTGHNNEGRPRLKLPTIDSAVKNKDSDEINMHQTNNKEGPKRKVVFKKSEDRKANTIENLMKFLKIVADTMSKNSQRSFSGKVRYLHDLKDTILANIEERIDAAWGDENTSARRLSRAARWKEEARGHVEFPSSESALMTISFLTFAVFLIKLVLQVIQTYKNKSMMVAPLVVAAASRSAFTRTAHHH